jgi:FdhE protein
MTGAAAARTAGKIAGIERLARERPEYLEILSVFREIFGYVAGREDATGIAFAVPVAARSERAAAGLPLIAPDAVRVDGEKASAFLAGLLAVMERVGTEGHGELAALGRALAERALDLTALFAACLARDRGALAGAAAAVPVSPSLLEFVLELPLKTALEGVAASLDPKAFEGWSHGHCPVCGGRAGMDELVGEEGRRYLSCSGCFFKWPYKRIKCPYCGSEDPASLSYFAAGDGPTRVGVCRACTRYIKTRDSRAGSADVPLEVEDLATLHLDLMASKEGFERGR